MGSQALGTMIDNTYTRSDITHADKKQMESEPAPAAPAEENLDIMSGKS